VTWEVRKVVQEHPDDFAFLQIHQDGEEIAHVYHHPDKYAEAEHRANLLAAAPKMLAALKDLADWLAYGLNKADGAEPTAEDHAACERVAAQARAAVDKAEGRS
jgi:hypothetical protein